MQLTQPKRQHKLTLQITAFTLKINSNFEKTNFGFGVMSAPSPER